MDGILLQQKVYKGYAIAAKHIGLAHTVYRSPTAIDPIASGNIIETNFMASFNVNWTYMTANKYGNAVWQCVCDGRVAKVGDFLVNDRTWFIIAEQHLLPILAVDCNETALFIERPTSNTDVNVIDYDGLTGTSGTTILYQNVPISILLDGRGKHNPVGLPLDTDWGRWMILVPFLGGVDIDVGDFITVNEINTKARYFVDANELTEFGWRLRCKRTVV